MGSGDRRGNRRMGFSGLLPRAEAEARQLSVCPRTLDNYPLELLQAWERALEGLGSLGTQGDGSEPPSSLRQSPPETQERDAHTRVATGPPKAYWPEFTRLIAWRLLLLPRLWPSQWPGLNSLSPGRCRERTTGDAGALASQVS